MSGTVLVRKVTGSQNARDVLATLPVFHMCAGGTPGHLPLCGLNNPQASKWFGQRSVQASSTTQLENKRGLKPGTDTRNGSLLEHVWCPLTFYLLPRTGCPWLSDARLRAISPSLQFHSGLCELQTDCCRQGWSTGEMCVRSEVKALGSAHQATVRVGWPGLVDPPLFQGAPEYIFCHLQLLTFHELLVSHSLAPSSRAMDKP